MTGKTHLAGGIALGIITAHVTKADISPVWYYASCALGALLPDIDHPHSLLGKATLFVPSLINRRWSHRTITHSLLFLILSTLLFGVITKNFSAVLGLFVGVLSHLILDTCNPTGVPWLYPINKKKLSIMRIRTGTGNEAGVVFMCALLTYCVIYPEQTYNFVINLFNHS